MRKLILLFLFCLAGLGCTSVETPVNEPMPAVFDARDIPWESYDRALERSSEEGKFIFIFLYSTHCSACQQAWQAFSDPEVVSLLNKDNVLPVKISQHSHQFRSLMVKYHLHAVPSYVFLDSLTQETMSVSTGAQDAIGLSTSLLINSIENTTRNISNISKDIIFKMESDED